MDDWLLGMLLVFLGCCCSAVGLVLLKHSTNVEEDLPWLRRPFWATGAWPPARWPSHARARHLLPRRRHRRHHARTATPPTAAPRHPGVLFLIVNASVIDVIAFSLAPLTLVAPFSGVTIVLTTWLASSGLLFVKEKVDIWDTTSTGIALIGVTMTTAFGPHIDDAKGANEMAQCFDKLGVHVFAALALGVLGFAWLAYSTNFSQLASALWFRIAVYAYTAALAGSASMLLLKVVGTGIRAAVEAYNKGYDRLAPGGLLVGSLLGLVCCAVVQLGFLHRTLANSPVSYGVPTYQTLLTVLTIIAGGIFFDEFAAMPPRDFVWFSTGVIVSLVGVAMHSLHRSHVDPPKDLPPLPYHTAGVGAGGACDTATPTTLVEETALTPSGFTAQGPGDATAQLGLGGRTPSQGSAGASERSRLIPR